MRFNDSILVLDNFREVLSDYTPDVQDIVRSSILDNVDISGYLVECSDDPFRLDQVRLGLKEGISSKFLSLSGEAIYSIRKLIREGYDVKGIETQVANGLTSSYLTSIIKWVKDGISLNGINVSIIPKNLLEVFDYGFRNDLDMREFNDGIDYPFNYVVACLKIRDNGKDIRFLLGKLWDMSVVEYLVSVSQMSSKQWCSLVSAISSSDSLSRVRVLSMLAKVNVPLAKLQERKGDEYVYEDGILGLVYNAYVEKLDINALLRYTKIEKVKQIKYELELAKKRKVSGRLVKS